MQSTVRFNQIVLKMMRHIVTMARMEAVHTPNQGLPDSQEKLQESEKEATGVIREEMDEFTKEFMSKRIQLTELQRFILGAGSSVAALINPRRHDMLAALGETTGVRALQKQYELMLTTQEGSLILKEKPRINTTTINLNYLRKLPDNTFGYIYVKFLDDNHVTPDSRMNVRFMEDPELAYVMTRYRECHDLVHTVLGMPTNMLGEVTVKWVEALNTGLPMCYGAALFGALRLRPKHRQLYKQYYLPWAIEMGRAVKPLLPIFWEQRWEQDVMELRNELCIQVLQLPQTKI